MILNKIFSYLIFLIPLFIGVILHEIAHGLVALKLGDPTAKMAKRLSLNPFRHVDLFMTILLPAMLILSGSKFILGGAKPVPVNPNYFKHPRRGMAIVALAGPTMNLLLALISYILLIGIILLIKTMNNLVVTNLLVYIIPFLQASVMVNAVLMIFNLVPILPLDGGRILNGILPRKLAYYYSRTEKYGFIILICFLLTDTFQKVSIPILKMLEKLVFF